MPGNYTEVTTAGRRPTAKTEAIGTIMTNTLADPSVGASDSSASFEHEVTPLLDGLYRHAMRMTRNHADAEDLLQDTIAKAYAGFHSYQPGAGVGAWMHRIMINHYINGYRKKHRRPVQHLTDNITDQQLARNPERSSTAMRSAEDLALESLPDSELKAAMETLPEQLRVAIYYADVEGRRCKEIAEIMHTPVGTVISRLHRGRKRLRGLLAERYAEQLPA